MDFSSVQILQLVVVGVIAIAIFVAAYSLPLRITAPALIFLIPFQPIVTHYATANVVLTYVVFLARLMREKDASLPLFPHFLMVLAVYLGVTGLQHPSTWTQHGIYIFNLISAYLVLCIVYEWFQKVGSIDKAMRIFAILNVLIVVHCSIQWIHGPGEMPAFLGFDDFRLEALHFTETSGYRLGGPFSSPGLMSEYFVIAIYFVLYQIFTTERSGYKRFLYVLLIVNLVMLLRTGNRGGILVLAGSIFLFAWLFRREIGTKRIIQLVTGISAAFVLAVAATVGITGKVLVFERLAGTEIQSGVPDSRQTAWTGAWESIKERPILGHGPRDKFTGEVDDRTYKHHKYIQAPHNLYLFLLFTVGVPGAIVFLVFLASPLTLSLKALKRRDLLPSERAMLKTGVIVMTVIFVDQVKVEFLRYSFTDYWHYIFAVLGLFTAVADKLNSPARNNVADNATPQFQVRTT